MSRRAALVEMLLVNYDEWETEIETTFRAEILTWETHFVIAPVWLSLGTAPKWSLYYMNYSMFIRIRRCWNGARRSSLWHHLIGSKPGRIFIVSPKSSFYEPHLHSDFRHGILRNNYNHKFPAFLIYIYDLFSGFLRIRSFEALTISQSR